MKFMRALPFFAFFLIVFGSFAASATELVMFESKSCGWCLRWHKEVGPAYQNATEGRLAPLRRVDVDEPIPLDLRGIRGIRYTPTFVLVHQGVEIGRINGYPGADFFWVLVDELIEKAAAGQIVGPVN